MNEIKLFTNEELGIQARTILNEDGSISINAEDTAIGFGWIQTQIKSGKEYTSIRWETLNSYCSDLGFPSKLGKDDFIPESLYYMLGMKASNERALKYQKWLAMDVLPSIRKTGTYKVPKAPNADRTEVMLLNAKSRAANTYLKLANVPGLSDSYKQILVSKATETLSGEQLIPLPKQEKKTLSAGDIGEMFRISSNKVGRIANEHGLKISKYGEAYKDKSRHSVKEVDTWRYFESVIPEFERILSMKANTGLVS